MLIHRLIVSPFQANCYIVADEQSHEAMVIDPGDDAEVILDTLAQANLRVRLIIATHGHIDHVMAVGEVKQATGAPFLIHFDDKPLLDRLPDISQMFMGVRVPAPPPPDAWLTVGETIGIGDIRFKILFTPGHSWGSVSLYWEPPSGEPPAITFNGVQVRGWRPSGIVFSGDALFAGSIGRTDLGGDFQTLARSIHEQLFTLPGDTLVLSGHGEPTTIGHERRTNPFVGEG